MLDEDFVVVDTDSEKLSLVQGAYSTIVNTSDAKLESQEESVQFMPPSKSEPGRKTAKEMKRLRPKEPEAVTHPIRTRLREKLKLRGPQGHT
jgi:hypothetical protein